MRALQLDAVFGLQVDGPITGGGGAGPYWGRAEGGLISGNLRLIFQFPNPLTPPLSLTCLKS